MIIIIVNFWILIIVIGMKLENHITIVIPCKNELDIISKTLDLLNYQKNIKNVDVIVCDSSDDETPKLLKKRKSDNFNLILTQGGYPSEARNIGAKLAKTPYILFLDADIFLLDETILDDCLKNMIKNKFELSTIKFESDNKTHNFKFKTFTKIQKIISLFSPFALGGFMLIKTKKFNELGGFDVKAKVAEDYLLSRQIKPCKFNIFNKTAHTTPRRYQKKSVIYMLKLVLKSYLNRNNPNFFKNDQKYWQ